MKNPIRFYVIEKLKMKNNLFFNIVYLFYSAFKNFFLSGFQSTNIENLKRKKNSDVLVILGAGASINELNEDKFKELSKYDVAGLSYSCILPIKQKFFFYESASTHETSLTKEHQTKVFPAVMKAKMDGFIQNIIWKNPENKSFSSMVDTSGCLKPIVCNVISDDLKVLQKIIRFYFNFKLYKFFLLQKRGSVSAILFFGLILGYRKILFVGIDLNSNDYFFEGNPLYSDYGFGSPYEVLDGLKSPIHRTNDGKYGIPITKIIKSIIGNYDTTEYYVATDNSALSGLLKKWKWKSNFE